MKVGDWVYDCVGPGWRKLLEELIADLLALGWDGELHQVKEKFGGLRFYAGAMSHEGWDRVERAEDESEHICEECGAPGEIRNLPWIKTLCDGCFATVKRV